MALDSVRAWRLLRTPFPLTEKSLGKHVCEWEALGVDTSGCRLCSHVHTCGYGKCAQVVQTTDALVCEITGVCIRTSNIVESAYSEEVISFGCNKTYSGDAARQDMYDDIEGIVDELLVSDTAQALAAHEREHYVGKLGNSMQRIINTRQAAREPVHILDVLQASMRANTEHKRYECFDRADRVRVAAACVQQLRTTIPICNRYLRMNIRRNDMRVVVFGVMFLMRSGICIHDISVLPHIPELVQLLPNESNLVRFFNFKSKFITDIENKFKFHLRNVTRAQMHHMGFHLVRQQSASSVDAPWHLQPA